MNNGYSHARLSRMTGLAIITALVAVLTIFCTFVRFGPFSITLALAPIVISGAVYGPKAGAYMGGVFGLLVLVTGLLGWDGGTVLFLLSQNALGCIAICLGKGIAAGFFPALLYGLLAKKNVHAGVVAASILCPLVNTGLFILGMMLFFLPTLESWAGGADLLYYIIVGLTGLNFLVELGANLLLSSGVTAIVRYGKGSRRE